MNNPETQVSSGTSRRTKKNTLKAKRMKGHPQKSQSDHRCSPW